MKLLVLLAVVCAASAAAPRWPRLPKGWVPPDTKIVGGEDVDIRDYPYQVALYYRGFFKCGGSIIGPNTILTAANCIYGFENFPSRFSIKYGVTNKTSSGNTAGVSKIYVHDEYGQSASSDIATMILSSTIAYSETASAVRLAGTNSGTYAGEDAVVSGWGLIEEDGKPSDILQAVQVPVITNEACKKQYEPFPIYDNMLCAGYPEGGKDSCQLDTGGPMIAKKGGEQIGVVSGGMGCGRPNTSGVYTRVSIFYDWITAHMQ